MERNEVEEEIQVKAASLYMSTRIKSIIKRYTFLIYTHKSKQLKMTIYVT